MKNTRVFVSSRAAVQSREIDSLKNLSRCFNSKESPAVRATLRPGACAVFLFPFPCVQEACLTNWQSTDREGKPGKSVNPVRLTGDEYIAGPVTLHEVCNLFERARREIFRRMIHRLVHLANLISRQFVEIERHSHSM